MSPTQHEQIDETRREEAGLWCARLADGGLSAAEQQAFETWLDQSPANRTLLDATVRTWQALEEADGSPELIAMRAEALEGVRRSQQRRWARGAVGGRRVGLALAASILMTVAAAFTWSWWMPDHYQTGIGERRVVSLTDGSKLSLDAATRVDVRYRGDRRELWLRQGRAKFAVAHDPLRAFSVAAAGKVVVATGTEFSVELLQQQVRVVLYEGRVAVLEARSGAPPQAVRLARGASGDAPAPADQALTPGRELIAAAQGGAARVIPADLGRTAAWEAGQIVFSDEPLASAVERMNRYGEETLTVGDPQAGKVPVSGVFRAGDTEAFVTGVTAVFPVAVRQIEGRRTFVTAPRPAG